MGSIKTIEGDATKPQTATDKVKVITHVCNDIGGWGSGFVLALNKTFGTGPKDDYKAWHKGYHSDEQRFALGEVQFVEVFHDEDIIYVANMIGQHMTGTDEDGRSPVRYGAIAEAMNKVGQWVKGFPMGAEIHAPMFGAGLAGGNWEVLEHMIREIWVDKYDLDVTIYEYQPSVESTDVKD